MRGEVPCCAVKGSTGQYRAVQGSRGTSPQPPPQTAAQEKEQPLRDVTLAPYPCLPCGSWLLEFRTQQAQSVPLS